MWKKSNAQGYFMDGDTLAKQIHIIFNREKILLKTKGKTWFILAENNKNTIIYEHSDTLVNIYAGLQTAELKEIFINNLLHTFQNEKEEINIANKNQFEREIKYISSSVALIFFTLLKLGFHNKLPEPIRTLTENCRMYDCTNATLVYFLYDLLSTERIYLNVEIIPSLLHFSRNQIISDCPFHNDIINNLQLGLANIGYEEIKESILGVNIEINRDKEKIITIFSNNGFDQKYEQLLKEIDEYINTNSTIVTSGMISNMRSFMQDLVTDLARKIAANNNEQIPKNEGMQDIGNCRYYLRSKLELSDNDHQLINKYIEVLHSEGGHSFTANVEYFRLAKNIGIEIGLFLLSKANNLKQLKYQLDS
ncbi:MAG: hypothetical protein LBH44_11070 [Treponema sp.]|jgi:hypothetical protein|nr:hypothetical protein [Treponema sp.]